MSKITVLDQSTINQIAAGEVIERPASVVKELLENAIDARATAVTVEIKDGGISFIRVTDNGCGIPTEELPLAFLRHSTSKIKTVEDLITVSSLGFRGEALSSIASVARVELITKTSSSITGARYQIDGEGEKSLEEIGAPEGTTFIVRDLFYNTPARKKFLKSAATEGAHVGELVEKLALSHPEISIRLIQNNQSKLHTSGNHNLKDLVYTVFGREIASNLLAVDTGQEPVKVNGFIGRPVIARGNRNYENYYINGRYIRSSLISKAIEEAYKPFMMQHKYPFTLLHFTIEPSFLDVNVHPTKMELRFRDGEMIYGLVYQAIAAALSHKELIPAVGLEEKRESEEMRALKDLKPRPEPFEVRRLEAVKLAGYTPKAEPAPSLLRERGTYAVDPISMVNQVMKQLPVQERGGKGESGELKRTLPSPLTEEADTPAPQPEQTSAGQVSGERQMDLFDAKLLTQEARKNHKLIGQLFDTYWLVQFEDNLFIIDQHAAHEKVLYEKTMQSLKNRDYTSQLLNPPIILSLGRSEELLFLKYLDSFTAIGFEIEHFGGREYAVRGVPDNLFSIAKKELLMEMIDQLSEDYGKTNPDLVNERVASMSCKAAVKGNQRLSAAEADRLIDQLLELENPYACPHGRPTIISMSRYELEKKFKRIV